MPLAVGHQLGPYVIEALQGSGGMGEVYRARDTRLGRTVAIKILPPGDDASAAARFEREGRAIAQLSHPHICPLFDAGTENGTRYLVMEYLQGDTLASRLARGPLTVREVLRYGSEIAEALDHAHRRGITHRDLKPANVMITKEGAKLLDFGLATLLEERPPSHDSVTQPHLEPLTKTGTVVGTTQYMSPEQIEGKPLDHRTDIFSLGIVMYEMLTGRRPFAGVSTANVMASILTSDPPPLPDELNVPPGLRHVVMSALEKDPERRWQTAHDVALQLRGIRDSVSGNHAGAAAPAAGATSRTRAAWLLLPLAAIGAFAGGWFARREPASVVGKQTPVRLRFVYPVGIEPREHIEVVSFAISPDGQALAFSATEKRSTALYLRRLNTLDAQRIDGTEGAEAPFWSPDGKWVGFTGRGKLWKTRADRADAPIALCDVGIGGTNATWGNGVILFAERPGGKPGIYRVSDSGGAASPVTRVQSPHWRHALPQFVPGSNRFLYLAMTEGSIDRTLYLGDLDSSATSKLAEDTSLARVVGDRVFYVREGRLFTQRADFDAARLVGEPVRLSDRVAQFHPLGTAEFDVAGNGTVVYRTRTSTGRLFLADRSGKELRLLDDSGIFFDASFSPDTTRVASSALMPSAVVPGVWLYEVERGGRDRLTADRATEVYPIWTRDGRSIVYSEARGSAPHLVQRSLDGGAKKALTKPGAFQLPGNFSADGKQLYFMQMTPGKPPQIMRALADGSGKSETVFNSSFDNGQPQVSPSGEWLAFTSNSGGILETYVIPLPGGEKIRISNGGGHTPSWSKAGDELFYWARRTLMSARRGNSGRWSDATVTKLFERTDNIDGFDVSPAGDKFAIAESHPGEGDRDLHMILNATSLW